MHPHSVDDNASALIVLLIRLPLGHFQDILKISDAKLRGSSTHVLTFGRRRGGHVIRRIQFFNASKTFTATQNDAPLKYVLLCLSHHLNYHDIMGRKRKDPHSTTSRISGYAYDDGLPSLLDCGILVSHYSHALATNEISYSSNLSPKH